MNAPDKLCPSCGARLAASANICSTCGYYFNTWSQPPPVPGQAPNWHAYPRYDSPAPTGPADGFAIAGLIFGILSLPTFCIWCIGPPFGILALVFGGLGLKGRNRGLAIAGMVTGGLSVLAFAGVLILGLAAGYSSGPWR
jgi:hypothetical protein